MWVKWIGIPIVLLLVALVIQTHAHQKIRAIVPNNAGTRIVDVSLGWHEWLRLDFEINSGTVSAPTWSGAYHWSLRNNDAWWGCSVD